MSNEYTYWPGNVKICNCLNIGLQESHLDLLVIILIILFCILNMLVAKCDVPQKIIP